MDHPLEHYIEMLERASRQVEIMRSDIDRVERLDPAHYGGPEEQDRIVKVMEEELSARLAALAEWADALVNHDDWPALVEAARDIDRAADEKRRTECR